MAEEKKEKSSVLEQCQKTGNFEAKVIVADIVEHRFQAEQAEIKVEFSTKDNQKGKLYLDLSEDYIQEGIHKGKQQFIRTRESLFNLGIDIADFSNIRKMHSMTIQVFGKPDKNAIVRFYLGGDREDKLIDPRKAKSILAKLYGGTAPSASKANPPTESNPIADAVKADGDGEEIPI